MCKLSYPYSSNTLRYQEFSENCTATSNNLLVKRQVLSITCGDDGVWFHIICLARTVLYPFKLHPQIQGFYQLTKRMNLRKNSTSTIILGFILFCCVNIKKRACPWPCWWLSNPYHIRVAVKPPLNNRCRLRAEPDSNWRPSC